MESSFIKNLVRFSIVLMLVCAVAAGLLSLVNDVTKVKIEENNRIEMEKKRQKVIPDATRFEEKLVSGHSYYVAYDSSGKGIGAAFQVEPRGYGGLIHITMGVSRDDTLLGIAMSKLDQTETPGLGMKITRTKFKKQFKNKKKKQIALRKNGGDIDAVTAATISSTAVVRGVSAGFTMYEKDKKEIFQVLKKH